MSYRSIVMLLFITFVLAGLPTPRAKAQPDRKAAFKELTATTSETHLIVFALLQNSFNTEMIETLHSGIPLRFSFFIEFTKITENWPEEQVASLNFQHIMSFDTLKETYKVTLEEENYRVLSFRSLFDAQKTMNEVNGLRVVELQQLIPENRYRLRIRAELYRKTLPMSLHSIFPFLTWWDVETDWHTLELKY
jgi:hypothetical protein